MGISVAQYKKTVKKTASEADLQTMVCKYLKMRGIRYRTDNDGVRVGFKARAAMAKQKDLAGFPDMIIREDSHDRKYRALVLELKKEGVKVYKKDGSLKADEHLKDQEEWLVWFRSLGCKAEFSIGYDATIKLIDEYFNLQ